MSKSVHYRLPDQLLASAREYSKQLGVTVTDLIIAGLQDQITGKKQTSNDSPAPEIVPVGDTVYEPGPVKPTKKIKAPASKAVAPMVAALLSGVKRSPIVQHHPQCTCSICKA